MTDQEKTLEQFQEEISKLLEKEKALACNIERERKEKENQLYTLRRRIGDKKKWELFRACESMVGKIYLVEKDDGPYFPCTYRKVNKITKGYDWMPEFTLHCTDLRRAKAGMYTINEKSFTISGNDDVPETPFDIIEEIDEDDYKRKLKDIIMYTGLLPKDSLREFMSFDPLYQEIKKVADLVAEKGNYQLTVEEFDKLELSKECVDHLVKAGAVNISEYGEARFNPWKFMTVWNNIW
jgi:hypothetical protein